MRANLHDFPSRSPSAAAAPPFVIAHEAEQDIFGAMLSSPEVLGQLASSLWPEHFGEEIHRRIYKVALDLFEQDKPVLIAECFLKTNDEAGRSYALRLLGEHWRAIIQSEERLLNPGKAAVELSFDDVPDQGAKAKAAKNNPSQVGKEA